MKKCLTLALAGTLVLLSGCGGEGGINQVVENESCPQTDARTCGITTTSLPAVLLCSAPPRQWNVALICPTECLFDPSLGAICDQGQPPDLGDREDARPADLLDVGPEMPELGEVKDTSSADVSDIYVEPEVVFKDLMPDFTPPWVESTSPEDQQMGVEIPFQVEIVFTEPLHAVTVGETTVKMTDYAGNLVPLSFQFVDEQSSVLLLTPTGAVFNSSPYTVTLEPLIKDKAGNMMGNNYQFSFYTRAVSSLGKYQELASTFAPVIRQATNDQNPQYDYLTRFDLDGDWVAEDNVSFVKKDAIKFESMVYYSVTETKSHYFITYIFYYPLRYGEYTPGQLYEFGNDASGALVVVRKPDEMPVAVETYFKVQDDDERSFSLVAENSGLIPPGKSYADLKFDGIYTEEQLFPGGRYEAYLSAGKHESCLWLIKNNSIFDGCMLNTGIEASLKLIEYVYQGGAVGFLQKSGGQFPREQTEVAYALVHLLDSWWVRRGDVGVDRMWAALYTYTPYNSTIFDARPEMAGQIPSTFVDPLETDYGRPPWAWKYNPSGVPVYNLPRGVWFLDPAVHFKQRHDQANQWTEFEGGSGWSTQYCFNPYFSLDFRDAWGEVCSDKME